MSKSRSKKAGKKDSLKTLNAVTMVVSRFGIRIIIYSALILLFYFGINKAYNFGYTLFTTKAVAAGSGVDITVTIQKDMTHEEIADLLKSKGLIQDTTGFRVQAWMYTDSKYPIQPGTYELNTSQTIREMIEVMIVEVETETETTVFATESGHGESEESTEVDNPSEAEQSNE